MRRRLPSGGVAIAPVALAVLLAATGAASPPDPVPTKVEVLRAPLEREAGCVARALRLPEGARPPRVALIRFEIGRSGTPESIKVLEPAAGPIAEALTAAVRSCAFEPARAAAGGNDPPWVVLPLTLTDREPPWNHLGDLPRATGAPAGGSLPPRAPVVDPDGLVDGASRSRLYALAQEARSAGRPALTIFVVPSLAGEELRDLAARAYLGWRLGSSAADDGLLLVVAAAERDWLLQPGVVVRVSVADAGLLEGVEARLAEGLRAEALGPALVEVAEQLGPAARAESGPSSGGPLAGLDEGGTEALWHGLASGLGALAAAVIAGLFAWWRRRAQPPSPPRPATDPLWLEVREREERLEVRTGVATAGLGWMVLVLAAILVWAMLGRANRGTEVLTCSRGSGRCTLTRGTAELGWVSLDATARFYSTPAGHKKAPTLHAVTRQGNLLLVTWRDGAELARQAEALNAFLADRRGDELVFEYDQAGAVWTDGLLLLALLLIIALPVWTLVGTATLTIDRAAGIATFRRPLWRRRLRLAEVVAVRVWSRRLDQIEAARRARRPVPFAPPSDPARRLVLVGTEGRRWPASRWLQQGAAQAGLEAAARRVSEFAGIPLAPDEPEPPPGTVPPPRP